MIATFSPTVNHDSRTCFLPPASEVWGKVLFSVFLTVHTLVKVGVPTLDLYGGGGKGVPTLDGGGVPTLNGGGDAYLGRRGEGGSYLG